MDLLLLGFSSLLKIDGKTLLSKVVCDEAEEKCMLASDCDGCTTKLLELLNDIVPEDDSNQETSWIQWLDVDGRQRQGKETGSFKDLVENVCQNFNAYKTHCYVKRVQEKYFKSKIDPNTVILQVDFSENFSIINQDEIKAAHWSHDQVTIFTAVAWLPQGTRSFVIVCHDMLHGKCRFYVS